MIPILNLNPYLPFPEPDEDEEKKNAAPSTPTTSRRLPFDLDMMQGDDNDPQYHQQHQKSPSSPANNLRSGLFLQSASPERRSSNKKKSKLFASPKRIVLPSHSQSLISTSSQHTHTTTASSITANNNKLAKEHKKQKKRNHNNSYYPPISSPSSPSAHQQQLSHRPYKGFSTPFCGLFAHSATSVNVGYPPSSQQSPSWHKSSSNSHSNAAAGVSSPSRNYYDNNNIELNDDDDDNNDSDAFASRQQQQHQEQYYHTKRCELHRAHRRTDLCSLTCFGILQSDYTRYLFTHTRPPTLCKRMCLHFLTPLSIFILAGWCSGNIRNDYVNSVVCTSLVYCLFVWIATACCRGRKKRVMVRDEILWRLKRRDETIQSMCLEASEGGVGDLKAKDGRMRRTKHGVGVGGGVKNAEESDYDEDDDEEEYDYNRSGCAPSSILGQSRREMHCAHRMIGCYPSDIPRHAPNYDNSNHFFSFSSSSPTSMRIRRRNDGYGETAISSPTMARGETCHSDEYVLQPNNEHNDTDNNDDICTKIWRRCFAQPLLSCIPCCCCNSNSNDGNDYDSRRTTSYGFHLQFCGLCALAQEAREANIALPRHLRMMDYITMEPFLLYYPRILELRSSATSSFWEHVRALSELSKLILVSFKAILLALLIISLSDAVKNWNLADMAVLITTFLQSFVVMYCVHWGWHRYDLSIDAVIKYFACGFVLCTSMAFVVEFLGLFVFKMTTLIVVGLLDVQEVQDNGYGSGSSNSGMQLATDDSGNHRYLNLIYGLDDDNQLLGHGRFLAAVDDILEGFFDRQPFAKILYILVSSYLMAGLVEELCKYFGFFMVDHPDFCSEKELEKSNASLQLQLRRDHSEDENEEVEQPTSKDGDPSATVDHTKCAAELPPAHANFRPEMQRRSMSSIRSGVTVAMVAVALGFACCENLFHIFIYNRSSVKSEIATLIVKSIFPIHPIAAAIQSIYVCRRDLEGDTTIGLGHTLLPSIVLRGTYEFFLLMIGWSSQRGFNNFYQEEHVTSIALLSFGVSLFLVFGGGLFYRRCSQAQYARLRNESEVGGNDASVTSFGLMV